VAFNVQLSEHDGDLAPVLQAGASRECLQLTSVLGCANMMHIDSEVQVQVQVQVVAVLRNFE